MKAHELAEIAATRAQALETLEDAETWQLTLFTKIMTDTRNHGYAPAGAYIAWRLGLAVYEETMVQGATYEHHRS